MITGAGLQLNQAVRIKSLDVTAATGMSNDNRRRIATQSSSVHEDLEATAAAGMSNDTRRKMTTVITGSTH